MPQLNAKRLTPDQRKHLLDQWAKGISQSELAAAFNISQSSVSYLVRRYVGAEPGKQVIRMMPGTALKDLRGRLQDTLDDIDRIRRDLRAMLALSGAVPTSEPEEQRAPGSPWARADALARTGEDAVFLNGIILFNGDDLDIEEFWRRHPRGIAKDPVSGGLLTYEEALDLRAELEGDLDHIPFSGADELDDEPFIDEKAAHFDNAVQRRRTPTNYSIEHEDAPEGVDQSFYRKAMRALARSEA